MRTIIYIILGTLGGIAIAYAALVLWFSFWMGNHIQDQLDNLGDGINAHFEVQDAKQTAHEADFHRQLVFQAFENDSPTQVKQYLRTANLQYDYDYADIYIIDGQQFGYENSFLALAYYGENKLIGVSHVNLHFPGKYAHERIQDIQHDLELLREHTNIMEGNITIMRTVALSKLRGQPYDDISQLIDAAGFDMIQKPDRIHVFMGAVRSVDFIFIDGTLSHITNNCAQAPETCHRQEG